MKKILLVLFSVLLLSIGTNIKEASANFSINNLNINGEVVTKSTNLNVREQANTTSRVLITVKKGEKVKITSKINDWYKITYKGVTGFVSADYIKPLYVVKAANATGYVKANSTATYLYPEGNAKVTQKLPQNLKLKITGTYGNWYRIELNKSPVFILKTSVSSEPILTAASGQAVVKTPSNLITALSNPSVVNGKVAKGDIVTLTGTYGNYYKIKTNKNVVGFVTKSTLDVYPTFTKATSGYTIIRWITKGYSAPSKSASYKDVFWKGFYIQSISKNKDWYYVDATETVKGKKITHKYYFHKDDVDVLKNVGTTKVSKSQTELSSYETDRYLWYLEENFFKAIWGIDLSVKGLTKAAFEKKVDEIKKVNKDTLDKFLKDKKLSKNILFTGIDIVWAGTSDWDGFVENFDIGQKVLFYAKVKPHFLKTQKGIIFKKYVFSIELKK